MSFALKTLDHVNVRTANLDAMIEGGNQPTLLNS